MNDAFYEKLKHDFIEIQRIYGDDSLNIKKECADGYFEVIESIRMARTQIESDTEKFEKKILLYCIDTLFDVLEEGNGQKIFDFADAIHNIPEICLRKRNLYSLRSELKTFQEKYGKEYFPFIDKVKPLFTKKAPKNKWDYFSVSADDDFKKLHPYYHKVIVFFDILALFLPQILYLAAVVLISPASLGGVILIGYLGSFIMGVGLFNIVSAWLHQYLGHFLTAMCLGIGAAMVLCSLIVSRGFEI
jgi:hypothetical protein